LVNLAACAELLLDSPHRHTLLNAWLGWRGDDLVPTTDAVKAEDLGTTIGYVSVIEVPSPNQAIFRLVGEWYNTITDQELLGENFIDMVADEHRPARGKRVWNIVSVPCGILANVDVNRPSGQKIEIRGLMLPVRPASLEEQMRAYLAVDVVLDRSVAGYDSVKYLEVPWKSDYIDIGFGVPV
jgi:hypothetical protein